ncbi:hypothetical protein GOP47_0009762 [Adiantum capillus-veneris]|uniref:Uncharacterized protein n=1 Tax=Adiantum capillus-veneris TaxID=13818 RepID=A0A9D4ZJS9_ADICA|nr:hypothetical protein GOP47_0009762 [Adiantum capillus-veneris]
MYTCSLEGGVFFPFLSSPSFNVNSSNASQSRSTPSFSLGLYFTGDGMFTYLSVCEGYMKLPPSSSRDYILLEGFVVPVWFANLDHPIWALNVSLVVVHSGDSSSNRSLSTYNTSPQLELRDGNQVVCHVSSAGIMEILDS